MESASWFSRSGIREAHSGGFNSVDVLGAGLAACGPADHDAPALHQASAFAWNRSPVPEPAQPAIYFWRPRSGRCDITGLSLRPTRRSQLRRLTAERERPENSRSRSDPGRHG